MPATPAEAMEVHEISSRLRKIDESTTSAANGWQLPDAARQEIRLQEASAAETWVEELASRRQRLLELSKLDPPMVGWVDDPLVLVAKASRQCGVINDLLLERRAEAAAAFRQAAADYRRANRMADAEEVDRKAAMLEDAASADVEAQVARARAAVDAAMPGTVEAALCRIELGELLLQASNTFEAREVLRRAQADMEAAGFRGPPGATATVSELTSSMSQDMGSGTAAALQAKAAEILKLRLAFHRLYAGLARAAEPPHGSSGR